MCFIYKYLINSNCSKFITSSFLVCEFNFSSLLSKSFLVFSICFMVNVSALLFLACFYSCYNIFNLFFISCCCLSIDIGFFQIVNVRIITASKLPVAIREQNFFSVSCCKNLFLLLPLYLHLDIVVKI